MTALRPVLLVSIVLCLHACTSAGQHRAHHARDFTADHIGATALDIKTRNGSLDVESDSSLAAVQISARFTCAGHTPDEAAERVAAAEVIVNRRADGTLTIEPTFPGNARNGDGANITVRLSDAHGVSLQSSNGRVRVVRLAGPLTASTSNGEMILINHEGNADLRTANGAITVQNLNGDLRASTSNGYVKVVDIAGSTHLRTSNGQITLTLQPDNLGPIDLSTSNGSIDAKVGPAFAGEVKMESSNGSLRINDRHGRVRSQTIRRNSGHLVVGEGGPASRLHTSNGSIALDIGG